MNKLFLIIGLLATVATLGAAERLLKFRDVRETMDEIFTYHVEYKELSPLVIQRSMRIYLEQFDADRQYLLRNEVKSFFELTPHQVEQIIEGYKRDDFSYYVALHELIEKSIERNRSIRQAKEVDYIQKDALSFEESYPKSYIDYAPSLQQLKKRASQQLMRFLKVSSKGGDILKDRVTKEKAFAFWERKKRRQENRFMPQNTSPALKEHLIAMHILKAMVRSLDAHSSYYSPDEAFDLRTSLKKQFEGVGVILREDFDGIFVAEMVPDGPAMKSGVIQTGDRLTAINGRSIADESYDAVLQSLMGPEKSSIELSLTHQSQPYLVKLKRERITLNEERLTYTYEPFSDGIIGKINLPGFYDNGEGLTAENDLRDAIRALKQKGPLHGIVLDMRENSGGFLTQAVKIASLFIPKGVIVISKYSDGEVRYFRDLDARMTYDGPLVILTSKLSASAAEIVAQALQDYGQALIVGDERTFGKGSMQYQNVTDEDSDKFFKVTVGRFYTVSGRSNQIEGVQADIVVPSKFYPYSIGERFLEYPLANDCLDFSLFDTMSMQQQKANRLSASQCIPYLQRRETEWRKMLPTLRVNSQHRLSTSANFQLFLKKVDPNGPKLKARRNFGVDDLQMTESVNILKDIAQMQLESLANN